MTWKKVAEFARPVGAKDKTPRKKRGQGVWGDVRTVADKGVYGAGAGFVIPGIIPIRSKRADRVLRSKGMNRIPVVGKSLRGMAISQQRGYDRTARKAGQYLAGNLTAQTATALTLGTAGLAYGANKVRQRRRAERLGLKRRG